MIFSNDWFVNVICSLVLSQHFHFLKLPKTDVIYVLRTGVGVRIKNQYFNVYPLGYVAWIRHWLSTAYVGCVSGGEGPKMINLYFNVYALRRVRTAGYATDDAIFYCCILYPTNIYTFFSMLRAPIVLIPLWVMCILLYVDPCIPREHTSKKIKVGISNNTGWLHVLIYMESLMASQGHDLEVMSLNFGCVVLLS